MGPRLPTETAHANTAEQQKHSVGMHHHVGLTFSIKLSIQGNSCFCRQNTSLRVDEKTKTVQTADSLL